MVPASDSSLLVVFGESIAPDIHRRVLSLFHALQAHADPRIRNLHPAYASLLIDFDPLACNYQQMEALVRRLAEAEDDANDQPGKLVEVPVCYDPEFGPDLLDVAGRAGISPEEVARRHSSATYVVYFLGFSPGFAYLGGLPAELHVPRLPTPRQHVPAGTVGIAGSQTAVYPVDSPGGWRLIGRTPLRLFDPAGNPPARLQPGDQVRFTVIDRATFNAWRRMD